MDKTIPATDFVEHEGTIYPANSLYLEKGTYTVTANYKGESGGRMVITSPLEADSEGHAGVVYADRELFDGLSVEFSVDKPTWEISVRFVDTAAEFAEYSIRVQTIGAVYWDTLFLTLVVLALGTGLYMLWRRWGMPAPGTALGGGTSGITGDGFYILLYLLAATFVLSAPYLQSYLYNGHDMHFQLIRIEGLREGILAGQFPVRVNPVFNNNLGYADAAMYPHLLLYIPALLRLCGLSLLLSAQVYIVLLHFGTLALGYWCFARLSGSRSIGLMAATLYAFSAYRLMNFVVRGSLGECTAMVFLPPVLLGMHQLIHAEKPKTFWLVLGLTGVFTSHIITTVLCLLYCGVYALFHLPKLLQRARLLALAKAAGVFLLLNLWAIVPILYYSLSGLGVYSASYDPGANAITPLQALFFGLYPPSLGILVLLGAAAYGFSRFARPEFYAEHPALARTANGLLAAGAAALFLSSTLFPWADATRVPLVGFLLASVQFPWRYLGFGAACLAGLGGVGLAAFATGRKGRVGAAALCFCACLLVASYLFTAYTPLDGSTALADKFTAPDYNTTVNFPPEYYREGAEVRQLLAQPGGAQPGEGVTVTDYKKRQTNITLAYTAENGGTIDLPLYYYQGYRASLGDGTALATGANEAGLVRVVLPGGAGSGAIRLGYKTPWPLRVGDIISLATACRLLAVALGKRKNTKAAGHA